MCLYLGSTSGCPAPRNSTRHSEMGGGKALYSRHRARTLQQLPQVLPVQVAVSSVHAIGWLVCLVVIYVQCLHQYRLECLPVNAPENARLHTSDGRRPWAIVHESEFAKRAPRSISLNYSLSPTGGMLLNESLVLAWMG